jgi:hypothetical protein
MYIDGVPQDWEFVTGSPYQGDDEVFIDPQSAIRINTTEPFPASGNSIEVEFAGPYGVRASYVCFSEQGSCEG